MEQGSEVPLEGNRHNTARFEGPEESIEREELKKVLEETLEIQTEKEKNVIRLYYYDQ